MSERNIEKYQSLFEEVIDKKKTYQGVFPLLDLSIGEEKSMPNASIFKNVKKAMKERKNHKYPDDGWDGLIEHFISHMKRRYQVDVSNEQVMIGCGAKSLLWDVISYLIDDGDLVVLTSPSYDIVEKMVQIRKAKIIRLPLKKENDYLPNLTSIPMKTWKKVKMVLLNFPNNPTGSYPDKSFLLELKRRYDACSFYLLNDAAYMALGYQDDVKPLWKLFGNSQRFFEVYTASKAYNLTGFRLGFLLADSQWIHDLKYVRNLYDSGTYLPLQYGLSDALDHEEYIDELKEKYQKRLKRMYEILKEFRYPCIFPKGTFYLYTGIPENDKWTQAKDFANALLKYVGILVVPFSEGGQGLRFSTTYETNDEDTFFMEFKKRLILFEDYLLKK